MRLLMTFDIIMKEGQLLKNRSRRERVRSENLTIGVSRTVLLADTSSPASYPEKPGPIHPISREVKP